MATKNEIVLYGTVGASFWDEDYFTARQVREMLEGREGPLTVRLNSGGGIATEGQAIYTILRDYPGEVEVVVEAVAASAASLLAMAGDTITMRRGSWMLIHDPAQMFGYGRGTADDHRDLADFLDGVASAYADVYAARAGLSRDAAREIMRAETLYVGQDAVDAGFASAFEDELAAAEAAFDYRIYAHAPEAARQACESRGARLAETAVAAMIAGKPRAKKEADMATSKKTAEASAAANPEPRAAIAPPPAPEPTPEPAAEMSGRSVARLYELGAKLGVPVTKVTAIVNEETEFDAALDKLSALHKAQAPDDVPAIGAPSARVTADVTDRFAEGAAKALLARAGMKDGERNEFSGMSLLELARASVEVAGGKVRATTKLDVAGEAFSLRMSAAHSTSDFPAILENIANKAMLTGFDEVEESYPEFTSVGTLSDFKPTKRVGIDAFPSLAKVTEDAEFTYGTMGDHGEPVTLATYGKLFKITRQAIVNDDLDAFTRVPQRMGRAARRTVGDLVFAVLTGNPTMSDGTALFHADHGNLAGSGGAPTVTTLEAAMAAMATQKDRSDNATLNIRPAFILAPYALRGTVMQLLESEYDPAKTTRAANTVRNAVQPIIDARLDTDSATAWYLAASPMMGDTIEVSYLDGNAAPFLDSKQGWSVDGVEFKVRIDAAATPLAWEGLYKNAGA